MGYGLEPILPDGKVGGFGREAVPLLQTESIWPGLLLMTQRVANVIAADAGIQLEGAEAPRPPPDERPANGPSAGVILLGIVIVLIVVSVLFQGGRRWPALVLARHVHESAEAVVAAVGAEAE